VPLSNYSLTHSGCRTSNRVKSLQSHEIVVANWQELLELAQRKFLRQVVQYADAMESSPFPRLFVLDFLSDEEKATLRASDEQTDEQVHQCPLAAAEAAEAAAAAADEAARAEVIFYCTPWHKIIYSIEPRCKQVNYTLPSVSFSWLKQSCKTAGC